MFGRHRSYFALVLILFLVEVAFVNCKMLNKIRCKRDKLGNDECRCPEDPITERYADEEDPTCDYFWLCHLGRAGKRKCAPQYAFHPTLRQCLPRSRIPHDLCKPLVECSLRVNRFVEDKKDCTKYFLCLYGLYSHWSCPENMYFEPEGEQCHHDRMQAEACIELARKDMLQTVGFEKPPPKTSISLAKAKAHMKEKEKDKKPKNGR